MAARPLPETITLTEAITRNIAWHSTPAALSRWIARWNRTAPPALIVAHAYGTVEPRSLAAAMAARHADSRGGRRKATLASEAARDARAR